MPNSSLQATGNAPSRSANGSSSSSSTFHCSTCRQDFASAAALDSHKQSSRHKVNLLAEQLKSSGGFHANMGGLQVSEFEETTLKVSLRGTAATPPTALACSESHCQAATAKAEKTECSTEGERYSHAADIVSAPCQALCRRGPSAKFYQWL